MEKKFAWLGLMSSVVGFTFINNIVDFLVEFGERYLSADHHLNPLTETLFLIFLISIFGVVSILAILTLTAYRQKLFEYIGNKLLVWANLFFDTDKAAQFFFNDIICPRKRLAFWVFLLSILIGTGMHFGTMLFGMPEMEGSMENISALLLALAFLFVVISVFHTHKLMLVPKSRVSLNAWLLLISAFIFLFLGEEISWGQHIFQWEATGVFKEYNYQDETNIHNFFNPILIYAYPIVSLGSFIVLFLVRIFPTKEYSFTVDLLAPHSSLLFLLLIMLGEGFALNGELYESMLSMLILFYALRVFYCIKTPTVSGSAI